MMVNTKTKASFFLLARLVLSCVAVGCSAVAEEADRKEAIDGGGKIMKIVPYTKNWNEGETDWSYVSDPTSAIAAWEEANNLELPTDYRRFMVRYNGGRVFPRLFKHKMEPLKAGPYVDETGETYLDLIFPWDTVESHWQKKTYGEGVPPGHLVIGDSPGGIQILMSVGPADRGRIFSWYHSTSRWSTGENTKTYPLADSFTGFLRTLNDNGNDYDDWHIPIYDKVAKDLEL